MDIKILIGIEIMTKVMSFIKEHSYKMYNITNNKMNVIVQINKSIFSDFVMFHYSSINFISIFSVPAMPSTEPEICEAFSNILSSCFSRAFQSFSICERSVSIE